MSVDLEQRPRVFHSIEELRADASKKYLQNLVAQQQTHTKNPIPSGNDLFLSYMQTRSFREAYSEEMRFLLTPRSVQDQEQNNHDLAGRLFQDIAEDRIKSQFPEYTFLNSSTTLLFYEHMYPDEEIIHTGLGQSSIMHISVPDGLLISTNLGDVSIAGIFEATASKREKYFADKISAHNKGRREYPEIFGDAEIYFVTPRNQERPTISGGTVMELPFTHEEFGIFVRQIYHEYGITEDSATLFDIIKRSNIQHKTGLIYRDKGTLTPEYSMYLDRIRQSRVA